MHEVMRRCKTTLVLLSIAAALAVVKPLRLGAQRAGGPNKPQVPRTVWGQPDLQGVWDFASNTPLQRPPELGRQAEYTEAELAGKMKEAVDRRAQQDAGVVYQDYNRAWTDDVKMSRQTSLIIDPPDGRLPAYTPLAQKWYAEQEAIRKGVAGDSPTPGGWVEDLGHRGLFFRCIVGFNAGPPMLPQSYNQNVQIFQAPDHVALLHEMVHNARVAWLDKRPHVSSRITGYNGDARGRWEGDTLIVESINFAKEVYDLRQGGGMRPNANGTFALLERFTRTSPDTLLYEYTLTDPSWYTAPVTVRIPMRKNPEPIYEYACHEGNMGLTHSLEAERSREAKEKNQEGANRPPP